VTNLVNVSLEIQDAKNIDRAGFVALIEGLAKNSVMNLNLSMINAKIDDKALAPLTTALNKKDSLQNISFTCQRCDNLTRRGVQSIATLIRNLPNLRGLNLDFQKCRRIGDGSVTNLGNGLKNNKLNYLNINLRDTRTTAKGLKTLADALKSTPNLSGMITQTSGRWDYIPQFVNANK